MTQILEHLLSNLTSGEVSKRCHFSLEIFKLSSVAAAIECLVEAYIATYIVSKTLRGPINNRTSHGRDNKLNEIKHSAQLVTMSAQRLAYGSMPLELAETRPRSSFPESTNTFSKVRAAKLDTDVKILMPGTDYFDEKHSNKTSYTCQHHAEITQSHTFAALVQAYTAT